MSGSDRAREVRVRRAAERRGWVLHRQGRNGPGAPGRYTLAAGSEVLAFNAELAEVEAYLVG